MFIAANAGDDQIICENTTILNEDHLNINLAISPERETAKVILKMLEIQPILL